MISSFSNGIFAGSFEFAWFSNGMFRNFISLLITICLVSGFNNWKNVGTSLSENLSQIQCFPHFCILFMIATWLATMRHSPNLSTVSKVLIIPFPKNQWNGLMAPCCNTRLFCDILAVCAASAQSWLQNYDVNLPSFSITLTWLCSIWNFSSTLPFCSGVPGAVYSENTSSPSCLHAFSNEIFSHALC